jgi:hypothetical protein
VLKELVGKKLRFNDGPRRRLAAKGKPLGRKAPEQFWKLITFNTAFGPK